MTTEEVREVDNAEAVEFLTRSGYGHPELGVRRSHVRQWSDGRYILIGRLAFHWTIYEGVIGMCGPDTRWCYSDEIKAVIALLEWPEDYPKGYEPEGWHRHPDTGRRRPGGDASREYFDP